MGFEMALRERAEAVEAFLDGSLVSRDAPAARLVEAMRHAVLGGGKRLRPFLLIESAALFAVPAARSLPAAAALECVHCYSLVHDDLPAMDDDDLRRGRPTVHVAFDEATAILAGDALLTLAFELLAGMDGDADTAIRADLVLGLARAAGHAGMAGGQALDMRGGATTPDEVMALQSMKTGALFSFAVDAGAILGRARRQEREALRVYGERIGLAFQLADDLIDRLDSTASAGKRTGKDESRGKSTLVDLWGIDEARRRASALVDEASDALAVFGARSARLGEAARFIVERIP
jgi:farnesyl diphosphate synthase